MKLLITTQAVDKNDPILGFFHGWVLEFSKHFDRIDVICLKEGKHEFPPHVHVHSLGKEEGGNKLKYTYRFYKYFWRFYMRSHVDYVFFHMGAIYNIMAASFFFIRRFKKTKFYWWKTHGHINLIGHIALCFIDRVYTAIEESFPIQSKKRHIVGHAIDTELFNFNQDFEGKSEILFVGRISRVKRIEQVLSVLAEFNKENKHYYAKIIGKVFDESYYAELRNRVNKQNIKEQVEFIEGRTQQEIVREYHNASVLMNPSDTDGLDKVVLEAMACGLLPITANLSFKKLLAPYGLFVKKGDIESYVVKIREIMSMSNDEREKLAKELRMIIVTGHSLATLSERIFSVS